MYGLSVEANDATIVVKTNELERACEVLKKNKIDTMTEEEIEAL